MLTINPMTMQEAIAIVNQYGADWNCPGLLETVEQMDEAFKNDELTNLQRRAYRMFIGEMEQLFRTY